VLALRKLLLSPAFQGAGGRLALLEGPMLDELGRVLDAPTLAEVRAHLAAGPSRAASAQSQKSQRGILGYHHSHAGEKVKFAATASVEIGAPEDDDNGSVSGSGSGGGGDHHRVKFSGVAVSERQPVLLRSAAPGGPFNGPSSPPPAGSETAGWSSAPSAGTDDGEGAPGAAPATPKEAAGGAGSKEGALESPGGAGSLPAFRSVNIDGSIRASPRSGRSGGAASVRSYRSGTPPPPGFGSRSGSRDLSFSRGGDGGLSSSSDESGGMDAGSGDEAEVEAADDAHSTGSSTPDTGSSVDASDLRRKRDRKKLSVKVASKQQGRPHKGPAKRDNEDTFFNDALALKGSKAAHARRAAEANEEADGSESDAAPLPSPVLSPLSASKKAVDFAMRDGGLETMPYPASGTTGAAVPATPPKATKKLFAPPAPLCQKTVFTFPRFVDTPDAALEDDGSAYDLPVSSSAMSESDFFASQAEASEMKAAMSQLERMNGGPGKGGNGAAAPVVPTADGFTVEVENPVPTVDFTWKGGDTEWVMPANITEIMQNEQQSQVPASPSDRKAGSDASTITHPPMPFEAFSLRVVYQPGKTGFEAQRDFVPALGSVIAGRYQVQAYLGSAAFSTAHACLDLVTGEDVCLKIVKNTKDFFDQSLDEVKLLRYINAHGDPDERGVLKLHDVFYHREHLHLVTELLKDNLYEFQKYLFDAGQPPYFTLPRIQRIAVQCLRALDFVHGNGLIHCDLKPENILIKSYSRCEVKVIDFGSSCLVTDRMSHYIQSRSYRAPEVILGASYGPKIDIWSLGCILAELLTGKVLFPNESVQTVLARMSALLGPVPKAMIDSSRDGSKYVSATGTIFERTPDSIKLLFPATSNLRVRLGCDDRGFLDFLTALLSIDPDARPTAAQALRHPWLQELLPVEAYQLPV
jgi:hypothetical protein